MSWFIEQLPIRMQNYLQKDIEIAKQMEKDQIIDAFDTGTEDENRIGKEYYEDKYSHPDPSDDETFNNFNHEGGIKYDN